jgi:hypothetical protein
MDVAILLSVESYIAYNTPRSHLNVYVAYLLYLFVYK